MGPLEKLASLSARRNARTDNLHSAARALLEQLEPHVQVGTGVEVNGVTLALKRLRSNVGYADFWQLITQISEYDMHVCSLEQPVDGEGYLHGDFHAEWYGPSRGDLVAFATRAQRFVDALIAREQRELANVDGAIETLERVEVAS